MNPIILITPANVAPEHRGVKSTSTGYLSRKLDGLAEGLTSTDGSFTDKDGVKHEWFDVKHVEQVPVRLYTRAQSYRPLVVPINGRRYSVMIVIASDGDDDGDGGGIPERATVTFTPTDAPETPFTTWTAETALAERLASIRAEQAEMALITENGDAEWVADENARLAKQITDLESGAWKLRPHAPIRFFGVPDFIQNGIFPALNGVAAQCLAVLETGWGDCGNVNILFACDADGVPCNVWFEASCC